MNELPKFIWLFYVIRPFENSDLEEWLDFDSYELDHPEISNKDAPRAYLYAWTINKKDAKSFIELRNKSRFISVKKKCDELFRTYQNYEEFVKEHRRDEIVIDTLTTRNPSPKNEKDLILNIPLLLTRFEIDFIYMNMEALDDKMYELYEAREFFDIIFSCMRKELQEKCSEYGVFSTLSAIVYMYDDKTANTPYSICLDEVAMLFSYFRELFV